MKHIPALLSLSLSLSLALSLSPSLLAASAAAKADGAWKWTATGRNGQPEESVLKLTQAKDGTVTGTLTDRTGTHLIANAAVRGNRLEFTLVRETPNGKVSVNYALNLDETNPKVSVERPDFTPAGRAAGKKRKVDLDVVKEKDDKAPAPKD